MKGENAMSSGKTAALGLNQWVLSDQFLMEEFNEDNRRVDAAVAPLSLVKLGEVVTSQSCQQIDLDVSGIDWEKYAKISILWQVSVNHYPSDSATVLMTANGNRSEGAYTLHYMTNGCNLQDSAYLFYGRVYKSNSPSGRFLFETLTYPCFGDAIFMTRNRSISDPAYYDVGGYMKNGSGIAAFSSLRTLNFTAFNDYQDKPALTFDAGCKFMIYGVRK